jgi:hypothetical protein
MRIRVAQEDIDKGEPKSARRCPIALAVCRAASVDPSAVWVSTNFLSIDAGDPHAERIASVPGLAREFIKLFDKDSVVEPFEFELELEG